MLARGEDLPHRQRRRPRAAVGASSNTATCLPVFRIDLSDGAGIDGFLVTQGKLVTWGLNGVRAYSL